MMIKLDIILLIPLANLSPKPTTYSMCFTERESMQKMEEKLLCTGIEMWTNTKDEDNQLSGGVLRSATS